MPNFLLIVLLAAFPALSTDMYLPAIPTLQELWHIPLAEANLSLIAFFVFFSVFLLVHGPLSDRFGRRPVLLGGIGIYVFGCFLCAAAPGIFWLVGARILQAVGASSGIALSLALCKDFYTGIRRQKILAYIGVIVPLSCVVAPMIGSWVLTYLSWRMIFILQGIAALIALYGSFRLAEPLQSFTQGGFGSVARRYLVLLHNVPFTILAFAFSFVGIGFFGYLAGSAHIFITGFGLSEQMFGLCFAINALGITVGSLLTSRLCEKMTGTRLLYFSVVGMIVAGIVLSVGGGKTVLAMVIPMFWVTFFYGMSRPLCHHMILDLVERDIGAASSVINFLFFLCASLAMGAISLDWASKPVMLGWFGILGGLIPLMTLLGMRRQVEDNKAARAYAQQGTCPQAGSETRG